MKLDLLSKFIHPWMCATGTKLGPVFPKFEEAIHCSPLTIYSTCQYMSTVFAPRSVKLHISVVIQSWPCKLQVTTYIYCQGLWGKWHKESRTSVAFNCSNFIFYPPLQKNLCRSPRKWSQNKKQNQKQQNKSAHNEDNYSQAKKTPTKNTKGKKTKP